MSKQHVIQSSTTDGPKLQQGIATNAPQVLDLSWGAPLHAGHCKLSGFLSGTLNNGPTLRLLSDGTAELLATFYSDDSGDVWVVSGLDLKDNHGVTLFTIPHFSSPATATDREEISWTPELHFPAVFFPSITQATMHSHC
jgi:hypothetical protein